MKTKVYVILLVGIMCLMSCCDDENLSLDFKNKFLVEKGEDGSFQRQVYEHYMKYKVIVLTQATVVDYKYNFDNVNKIAITNSDGNKEDLQYALDLFNEMFTNSYPVDFIKEYTPINVILCNKIRTVEGKEQDLDYYVGNNFIALAGVNDKLKTLSGEEKQSLKNSIHADLWSKYLFAYCEKFKLESDFYNISRDFYGKEASLEEAPLKEEDALKAGFVDSHNFDFGGGDIVVYRFLDEREDVFAFIKFIFSNKEADLQEKFQKYPLVKEKYFILKDIIENRFKIKVNDIVS